MEIAVIAYYVIKEIDDPMQKIKTHKKFLESIDCKGRIYIGNEGVNAQISVAKKDLDKYLDFLKEDPLYESADIKIHEDTEHRFAKLIVKFREQIVALDEKVDFENRGDYITPEEWEKKLDEKDENTIIIDVRNNYESEVGHFDGALKPDKKTFREFIEYADNLAKMADKEKKTVLMYCTGGIRCEFYSPLMKERGFKNVHQLKGGVIAYGLQRGSKHWKGKLFVFDDRLVVPISKDNNEVISKCKFCGELSDIFYNCANMDCNDLFLSCKKCAEDMKGCCSEGCIKAPRVREMDKAEGRPTPFRKLSFEEKQSLSVN
ncbi:MAG: hypothetical protein S4CHLAM20_03830 [Chlamydiia bacterium]|nr:hypothetical protein [Chlamydiia bacterium]